MLYDAGDSTQFSPGVGRALSGLHWVWCNRRGPHLEWRQEPQGSSPFMTLIAASNYLVLCHPLLLLPSIFPSIRVFSNESALPIRWPKYWSFSFSISPSSEYSGLISFRIDWFDFLVVFSNKSLLQYYSSKASILQCSALFTVQLSHPYMTTGKTVA